MANKIAQIEHKKAKALALFCKLKSVNSKYSQDSSFQAFLSCA